MSRKDYKLLASALLSCKPERGVNIWARTVRAIAVELAKDNPRFDMERFFEACEYKPQTVPARR